MDDREKFTFNELNIQDAPASAGIYVLYEAREAIYVGATEADDDTIQSCLRSHSQGERGACTKAANYFSYEVVARDDLKRHEKEMLDYFEFVHKRPPRCN